MTDVIPFARLARSAGEAQPKKYYWSVCFECTAEEVLSVKVSDVGDSAEDKRRVAECLRNLADDIEYELEMANGPQTK